MDDAHWLPMSYAPRDGSDIIATIPERSILFFIRWDGERWMNREIPVSDKLLGLLSWCPLGSL